MSPSFLGIFCVFLAGSAVVHSSIFEYELSPRKFFEPHNYWDHPSWNDQYDRHRLLMKFYRQHHIDPNAFEDYLSEFPLYHEAEFSNGVSESMKLPREFFKYAASKKSSVSTEYLPLIIRNVPSSDSEASNSMSSTFFGRTNPVSAKNILYDNSDAKISIKDETDLGAAEHITSTVSESGSFTQDFQSHSSASQESKSTEIAEDSNFATSIMYKKSVASDSASNSKVEKNHQETNAENTGTDSSSIQNTVSPNDSSYSISNEEDVLSTTFKPSIAENTGSTDLSTAYPILADSSAQSMSHQSINPVTDETGETSTIMESRDEESKLTKLLKPSTVSQSSKSVILSTRGSYSSVSHMTSSSNNGRLDSNSTSNDEQELHESRDRFIITEHETVIEISSIRTAKVVVSAVFLTIALVATGVLTVFFVKSKRKEVQYDQLTLLP